MGLSLEVIKMATRKVAKSMYEKGAKKLIIVVTPTIEGFEDFESTIQVEKDGVLIYENITNELSTKK